MKVTVYSRTSCPPCRVLKHWLTQKNISYVEKDVEIPENRTELETMGFVSVPVTVVGGEAIVGPNFHRLWDLLN